MKGNAERSARHTGEAVTGSSSSRVRQLFERSEQLHALYLGGSRGDGPHQQLPISHQPALARNSLFPHVRAYNPSIHAVLTQKNHVEEYGHIHISSMLFEAARGLV